MPMPSWKDDPLRNDLTDKETVIRIAKRLGDDYVVVKYKDRSIYNILHCNDKKLYDPGIAAIVFPERN